jgi:hypothetical protein
LARPFLDDRACHRRHQEAEACQGEARSPGRGADASATTSSPFKVPLQHVKAFGRPFYKTTGVNLNIVTIFTVGGKFDAWKGYFPFPLCLY